MKCTAVHCSPPSPHGLVVLFGPSRREMAGLVWVALRPDGSSGAVVFFFWVGIEGGPAGGVDRESRPGGGGSADRWWLAPAPTSFPSFPPPPPPPQQNRDARGCSSEPERRRRRGAEAGAEAGGDGMAGPPEAEVPRPPAAETPPPAEELQRVKDEVRPAPGPARPAPARPGRGGREQGGGMGPAPEGATG